MQFLCSQLLLIKEIKVMQNQSKKKIIRIVAISDTHVKHKFIQPQHLPPADIFIHAGDFTRWSRAKEFDKFRQFLAKLPYKHKIVIPGNHDFGLEADPLKYQQINQRWKEKQGQKADPLAEIQKLKKVCTLLIHDYIQVEGLWIFGSPYVLSKNNMGFTYSPQDSDKIWQNLPQKIDILITHGPPYGIRDMVAKNGLNGGCPSLLKAVQFIQPKLHIFGHIHQSFGNIKIGKTHFYNVGYLDQDYAVKNNPVLIELQVEEV